MSFYATIFMSKTNLRFCTRYAILKDMNKQDKKAVIKIMVAINISHASGRDMLSGIFKFLEKNAKWQMHLIQYSEDFTPETSSFSLRSVAIASPIGYLKFCYKARKDNKIYIDIQ